jgi:hypothetical protein
MKFKSIILLAVTTLTLSLVVTACTHKSAETVPTATASTTAAANVNPTTPTATPPGAPTAKMTAGVDSAEQASEIAGFKVIEPSYVPEGYLGGKFTVTALGAGLPEEMKPKFNSTQVQRAYHYQNDPDTMILLIQMVHEFSVGGGEPTELCGRPAERKFTAADPQRVPHDSLTFGWVIDGNYFSLTGWLNDTLDEAALVKMACSISIK